MGRYIITVKRMLKRQEPAQLSAVLGHELILEHGPQIQDDENTEYEHEHDRSSGISTQAHGIEGARLEGQRKVEQRSG
jgi:hypothetical protein